LVSLLKKPRQELIDSSSFEIDLAESGVPTAANAKVNYADETPAVQALPNQGIFIFRINIVEFSGKQIQHD
jgi:hypothetical protein